MCRREMVATRTQLDDEAVVGDECHIVSGQPQGPRYVAGFPAEHLDSIENLILLCRVHHKQVDDQQETYTVELLQQMKANHEKWVSDRLSIEEKPIPPVRLRRLKENIPKHLVRLNSGRDILTIIEGTYASDLDHDDLETEEEVALVGEFLQEVRDWGDIGSDLEPSDRVRTAFQLTRMLKRLEEHGFMVFGGREVLRLECGIGTPSSFPSSILRVVRETSPEIIRINVQPGKDTKDADGRDSARI